MYGDFPPGVTFLIFVVFVVGLLIGGALGYSFAGGLP